MHLLRAAVIVPLVGVSLLTIPAATADGTEVCSDSPKVATSFCMTYGLTADKPGTGTVEHATAAPVDLHLDLANTSTGHAGDGRSTVWLDHVSISLLAGLDGRPIVPSASLPNNLLIAGTSEGCPPANGNDFSGCTDGNGTFAAFVSGTGLFDGVHTGTFGVQKIVNVNPPATDAVVDWQLTIELCLDSSLSSCTLGAQTQTFEITAGQTLGSVDGTTITFPTSTTISPVSGGTIEAALDSLHLFIHGQSQDVDGGADPAEPLTIVHLPTECGTATADATFVDKAATEVAVPLTHSVTSCPIARITSSQSHPYRATFDGSTSSSPVAGRTIAKYLFAFGDGTHQTTTHTTFTHTFSNSHDRTVSLLVMDSLGALSHEKTMLLKGTTLTAVASKHSAHAGDHLTVAGRLTRWNTTKGLRSRHLRLERCHKDLTHCALITTLTTSSTGRWSKATTFSAMRPTFRVTFAGGGGFLGTRAKTTVKKL